MQAFVNVFFFGSTVKEICLVLRVVSAGQSLLPLIISCCFLHYCEIILWTAFTSIEEESLPFSFRFDFSFNGDMKFSESMVDKRSPLGFNAFAVPLSFPHGIRPLGSMLYLAM